MKSKKSVTDIPIWLVAVVIALIALVIYLVFFVRSSSEGFSGFKKEIDLLGDCDKDAVINRLDKCPCDETDLGSPANDGCPEGYRIRGDNKGKEDRSCLEKKCPKAT